jgi:beta-galactosidase
MVAEGIIGGKVVCTERRMPARRSTKLRLYVDRCGTDLVADGSDFIVVVAEVTDDNGHVRRLAKDNIVFSVEGEGEIIGDASTGANPRAVEFGSAPVLIRSTRKAGRIKVTARVQFEGTQAPKTTELELESVPAPLPFCFDACYATPTPKTGQADNAQQDGTAGHKKVLTEAEQRKLLEEVEQQQKDFGIGK